MNFIFILCFILFILLFLLSQKYRKYLIGISLGLLVWRIPLRFAFSGHYSIGVVWLFIPIIVFLLYHLLNKYKNYIKKDIIYKTMYVFSILLILRILIEPPGYKGSGGVTEASYFVIALFAFFAFRYLTSYVRKYEAQCKIAIIISITGLILHIILSINSSEGFYKGYFYHFQMWLIASITLSYFFNKETYTNNNKPILLFSLIFIIFSILTPHRSRPVFAILNIIILSLLYGKKFKLIYIGTFIIVGIGLMTFIIPRSQIIYTRSLSAIYDILNLDNVIANIHSPGTLGAFDRFRTIQMQFAWNSIKSNPLLGRSFSISQEKLLSARLAEGSFMGKSYSLSITGAYHNAIVELAVLGGIPLALLASIIIILKSVMFFKWVKKLPPSNIKFFCSAIYGFYIQVLGQMLVNGGGNEFMIVLTIFGIMNGLMFNKNVKGYNENSHIRASTCISS